MAKVLVTDTYLEDIADSIRAKNGSSDTYTPSQMSTAIDNLPSGGGSIQSLDDFKGAIRSWYDYLLAFPNTYTTYTNDSVTLYTPDANCQKYTILRLGNNKYKIYWFTDFATDYEISMWGNSWRRVLLQIDTTKSLSEQVTLTIATPSISNSVYYSADYDTLEDCLQAIQSNVTTYTASSSASNTANAGSDYIVPYTNAVLFVKQSDGTITGPVAERRISKNETISVIS